MLHTPIIPVCWALLLTPCSPPPALDTFTSGTSSPLRIHILTEEFHTVQIRCKSDARTLPHRPCPRAPALPFLHCSSGSARRRGCSTPPATVNLHWLPASWRSPTNSWLDAPDSHQYPRKPCQTSHTGTPHLPTWLYYQQTGKGHGNLHTIQCLHGVNPTFRFHMGSK